MQKLKFYDLVYVENISVGLLEREKNGCQEYKVSTKAQAC